MSADFLHFSNAKLEARRPYSPSLYNSKNLRSLNCIPIDSTRPSALCSFLCIACIDGNKYNLLFMWRDSRCVNCRHGSKKSVTSRVTSQKSLHPLIAVKLTVYCHVVNSLEFQANISLYFVPSTMICRFFSQLQVGEAHFIKRQLLHPQQK
jgi:hypothetical protein